jgi:hypothetical protein
MSSLYDTDFYEWTAETARLLREGRIDEADIEHVAEEIEDMGKRDLRELRSRVRQILIHLLKLKVARDRVLTHNQRGWQVSIGKQQAAIRVVIEQSPSLRRRMAAAISAEYPVAARLVAEEFDVRLPGECPFSEDDVLGEL